MSGRGEALTAPCPVHPDCGCAPASPLPCTCPPLTPGLRERIEAAAAREALGDEQRMAVERVIREWCHIGPDIEARLAVALAHLTAVWGKSDDEVAALRAQRGGEG